MPYNPVENLLFAIVAIGCYLGLCVYEWTTGDSVVE